MRKRGFWRHILIEGIVLFGMPLFVIFSWLWWLLRDAWKQEDASSNGAFLFSVLFFLIGGLIGGFFFAAISWKSGMRAYRKSKAQAD